MTAEEQVVQADANKSEAQFPKGNLNRQRIAGYELFVKDAEGSTEGSTDQCDEYTELIIGNAKAHEFVDFHGGGIGCFIEDYDHTKNYNCTQDKLENVDFSL